MAIYPSAPLSQPVPKCPWITGVEFYGRDVVPVKWLSIQNTEIHKGLILTCKARPNPFFISDWTPGRIHTHMQIYITPNQNCTTNQHWKTNLRHFMLLTYRQIIQCRRKLLDYYRAICYGLYQRQHKAHFLWPTRTYQGVTVSCLFFTLDQSAFGILSRDYHLYIPNTYQVGSGRPRKTGLWFSSPITSEQFSNMSVMKCYICRISL